MDFLWTPWRYAYIAGLQHNTDDACVFCRLARLQAGEEYVLCRGEYCYVVLNRFPYTSGHSMVVPYRHFAAFHEMSPAETTELIATAQRLQRAIESTYGPEGFNIGWNQGKCAGAGVAGHLHLHLIPRWVGDSNLVSTMGETRVLPEDLATTFTRLKASLNV
ncbi:MAG TPA: HIT domain-containing protein [Acidobacteriota bacterium]|nr:HIT domain-containing protein [Acidobacteriota bacterium]HQM62687.1 HIT domain-containing protein [Acidobacteriota bacterium]